MICARNRVLPASRTLNGALAYRRHLTWGRPQPLIDLLRQMFVWECHSIGNLTAKQSLQRKSGSLPLPLRPTFSCIFWCVPVCCW